MTKKKKKKLRWSIIFVSYCSLKAKNLVEFWTTLKFFTVFSGLVANFLNFVVKFFYRLPSIYDRESKKVKKLRELKNWCYRDWTAIPCIPF